MDGAQAEHIRELEAKLDAYNRRWKLLQEKVAAYDEIAARELGNSAGYYFSECSKVLKEALEDAEQIIVEQPPTPVQPRKRHRSDIISNGWYL